MVKVFPVSFTEIFLVHWSQINLNQIHKIQSLLQDNFMQHNSFEDIISKKWGFLRFSPVSIEIVYFPVYSALILSSISQSAKSLSLLRNWTGNNSSGDNFFQKPSCQLLHFFATHTPTMTFSVMNVQSDHEPSATEADQITDIFNSLKI